MLTLYVVMIAAITWLASLMGLWKFMLFVCFAVIGGAVIGILGFGVYKAIVFAQSKCKQ